jgi:uridine kinase
MAQTICRDAEAGVNYLAENVHCYLDHQGQRAIVLLAGGSGAGKDYIAFRLQELLTIQGVPTSILDQDRYYKGLQHMPFVDGQPNFDHPSCIKSIQLERHLGIIADLGSYILVPNYCFETHGALGCNYFFPGKAVIVPGNFVLNELILPLGNITAFIDAAEEVRLGRRLARDVQERGRTEDSVQEQWEKTVQPMYKEHIEPTSELAQILILNE